MLNIRYAKRIKVNQLELHVYDTKFFVTSIFFLRCHNQTFLTTQIPGPFPDFPLTFTEFSDISRFPEIPKKW